MFEIRTGNRLSSDSSEAVALYQHAIDLILGSESGAAQALDKALELDKNFALASAARYYVGKDIGEPGINVYRELAQNSSLNATDWERQHIDILIGLIDQPRDTQEKALVYIDTTPSDLLVVSQLTGSIFFYGGPKKLETVLEVLESVAGVLADDWAFLARLGFAASEAGQRHRGRELIERALDIRPQALYSIHGLAHVLHDDNLAQQSAMALQDWLTVHGTGARNGQMYGHVQWHLALSEWQIGNRDAAMQRYLSYCAPTTTTCGPVLTLADCGGFLLRDYLQSGQVRGLGSDVLTHIDSVWQMMGHPFIALHVAGLYASAGDVEGLNRCREHILAMPLGANRDISLALVSSLTDFVMGNYLQASQTLATISSGDRIGIGGSNVERILVELIELNAKARL